MKKGNDKLAYYLPITASLGLLIGVCFDNIDFLYTEYAFLV